jgi:hypothetical protein
MNTDFTPGVDPEEVKIKIPEKLKLILVIRSKIFFMVLD